MKEHPLADLLHKRMIHNATLMDFKAGAMVKTKDRRDVILCALDGNFAMVRRPGCMRYVCGTDELERLP